MTEEKSKEIPAENRIFVNRTLNMSGIKLIGFDMDYTIATYKVSEFEAKTYEIVKNKLVEEYAYPEDIKNFDFRSDFIIRGLVIDTHTGDILKLNRYGFVRVASHGTRFYSFEEQKEKYGLLSIDITNPRYYTIHTLFSQAEGCIFAQLVDYYEEKNIIVNYSNIFNDVRKCMCDAHQETELKGEIVANPSKYLILDKRIVDALLKFKKYGKKLALITNSDFEYSNKIMEYCFKPFIDTPWHEIFDLVIVSANKPEYFTGSNRYLRVDKNNGFLTNFYGQIEWGGVYQGGNARILEKHLELKSSEILYMGDHIHGDVVTLKETTGWRTGLVVKELAEEVPILEKAIVCHEKIKEKMVEKEALEDISNDCREKIWLKYKQTNDKSMIAAKAELDQVRAKILKLDEEIRDLIFESQKGFNPYWGEVMRAGNEVSRFSLLVERYACIYMSEIANLYYYSPFKYYRSQRRLLAHDPEPIHSMFSNANAVNSLSEG